jgi:photosynthetic reaction center cytochrome c subunit/tetratricopeptide repeat protein
VRGKQTFIPPAVPFSRVVAVAVLATLLVAPDARAQGKFPPDSLVNVKVIPKNTPMREVIAMMRNFAGNLGVRCTYCHVGEESIPLSAYDFVSDEKRPKQVARMMLQMINAINGQHLSNVPGRSSPELTVTCETCHRGVARPEPIEGLIERTVAAAGVDSAARAYRNLITRLERRGAYNFTDLPLSQLARTMAQQSRFDEALGVLAVNEETHPQSATVAFTRGDILLARRDTNGAVAAYRLTLQRDSAFAPARAQLRALGRQP